MKADQEDDAFDPRDCREGWNLADRRMILAGYRLADVLTRVVGN
jgi:hypothetical protein